LGPHMSTHEAQLALRDPAQPQVWCDPQRLGILLTVLLIELLQQPAAQHELPIVIQARIAAQLNGQVALELCCVGNGQTEPPTPTPTPSLGMALCEQIAQEMHGTVHAHGDEHATWGCSLQLPLPLVSEPQGG
jgi:C4-dicarboxylate-specific signal transduction histidine kinase